MARWILARHADAVPAGRDLDRPLSEQGRADAMGVGRWLAHIDWLPDRVLVSPAARAQETARCILVGAQSEAEATLVPALYSGRAADYLDVLLEPTPGCTLVVGHNPSVEEVVEARTGRPVRMSPGSVACWEEDRLVHLKDPRSVRQPA